MNDSPSSSAKKKLIRGATGDWEVVIGLEVHAQVTSQAKLFSGASTEFGGAPNSHVSLVDAAMPGMLPVINEECIKQAVRTGHALRATINPKSVFDRKNYFYPDLPQGYQISQYKSPIASGGEVEVDLPDGDPITVRIERLHLEQDAGKLLHDQHPTMSLVDLNRSGVALMEIVSKPDLRSAEEAKAYVSKLRSILRYLGTCDGDMEKGNLRADVNVSVCKPGEPYGTRCEIKNVNSIRFIGQAIESEARRQIDLIEDGGTVVQETRLFDPDRGETRPMRTKEEAHDYRYFPDPDLLPLELTQDEVDALNAQLPELPDAKRSRYVREYNLSPYLASVLVDEPTRSNYFEQMVKDGAEPKAAANWLVNEYLGRIAQEFDAIGPIGFPSQTGPTGPTGPSGPTQTTGAVVLGPTGPAANSAIVQSISCGEISGAAAKEVLSFIIQIGPLADPSDVQIIIRHRQLKQVTDLSEIEKVVDEIVTKNPDKVADAKANPKAIGWFVGQVMKASGGKANPQAVNDLLKRKLDV